MNIQNKTYENDSNIFKYIFTYIYIFVIKLKHKLEGSGTLF